MTRRPASNFYIQLRRHERQSDAKLSAVAATRTSLKTRRASFVACRARRRETASRNVPRANQLRLARRGCLVRRQKGERVNIPSHSLQRSILLYLTEERQSRRMLRSFERPLPGSLRIRLSDAARESRATNVRELNKENGRYSSFRNFGMISRNGTRNRVERTKASQTASSMGGLADSRVLPRVIRV